MSVDFLNSPYGLFTPMNYWMLQNAAQQYGSSLNFMGNMGMGGMPGYIPVTSSDTSGTHTATPSAAEKAQQKKDIEVQLEEAFSLRAQLSDYVDVNTSQGVQRVNAEAFNKETGYIAEDGKDDGKISWTNKLFNFGKGCVNLVTDMFFDENGHFSLKKAATTLVVGGALGVAAFLIPGAGAVLAGAALAGGALTLGTGIVQSITTTTDEGAEKAWQNIGSGTLQTVLAAFGIRKVGVNAANKLGVQTPKTWRLDQSFKLGLKSAKADISAAGGMKQAIRQNFNQMKIGIDKFVSKFGYSHYENKYTNNLNKLKTDIPGAGTEYRQYADDIAAAYENIYKAKTNAEYTQAVDDLQRLANAAKTYRTSNTGLSDEAAAAFDDMIKMAESIAPRGAYNVRFAKFGTSGYTQKMADLDTQISGLRALGNTATPEQQFKLRILTRIKAATRSLYNANSPAKQKSAAGRFEQIAQETLTKMEQMRNNPSTTADVMKSYNDIVIMAQEQAMKANLIVESRAADLTRYANVLKNQLSTDAQKTEARSFIKRYLSSTPANDEAYISSVDDIIKGLKFETKNEGFLQIVLNKKAAIGKKTGNGIKKYWNKCNTPQIYVTSNFNRWVYPQSVQATRGTVVEGSELDAMKKANEERITQLQEQYKALS